MNIQIKPFNIKGSSDEEYARINECMNRSRAETLPDDPPELLEETINFMQNIPPMLKAGAWAAWRDDDDSEMVGYGVVYFMSMGENKHLVEFNVYVVPEMRRQGIGRRLLESVVELPLSEGRRLMMTQTSERIPAGEVGMKKLGAKMGMATHVFQLDVAELDLDQLRMWQERAQERASGFELGLWEGPYPEADLSAIAELYQVMNFAPHDDLELEDEHYTPEHLRQMEQLKFASGEVRWTMYARERASGEFAGFTEVMWNPNSPEILRQDGTGVHPRFRNKGLGRWLKAALMDKILHERPQVKRVRTTNADSNAAMLHINEEMGFKPYQSQYFWQIEVDEVLAYLAKKDPQRVPSTSGII